jgi:hypothetical protein
MALAGMKTDVSTLPESPVAVQSLFWSWPAREDRSSPPEAAWLRGFRASAKSLGFPLAKLPGCVTKIS